MTRQYYPSEAPQFGGTYLGRDERGRVAMLIDRVVIDDVEHAVTHPFEAYFEASGDVAA